MTLPLLISVPHAGVRIPPEAEPYCVLSPQEVERDSDEGAAEIYTLEADVAAFVTTDVARAIVDLNRAENDRRKDGVIKTHSCWNVPVYDPLPPEPVVQTLLDRYYRSYHRRLTQLAGGSLMLGVDCHTMAAIAPPVAPDPGQTRPWVCLSNGDGTCPARWMTRLAACFEDQFGANVSVNRPFTGGYITRHHASEMPWVQVELSRGSFLDAREKRRRVLAALRAWVALTEDDDGNALSRHSQA